MNKDLLTGFNMSGMVQHVVIGDPVKDHSDQLRRERALEIVREG